MDRQHGHRHDVGVDVHRRTRPPPQRTALVTQTGRGAPREPVPGHLRALRSTATSTYASRQSRAVRTTMSNAHGSPPNAPRQHSDLATACYPLLTGTLFESALEDRRGISRRAPMPSTQQPMMYQLMPVLDPVFCRILVA